MHEINHLATYGDERKYCSWPFATNCNQNIVLLFSLTVRAGTLLSLSTLWVSVSVLSRLPFPPHDHTLANSPSASSYSLLSPVSSPVCSLSHCFSSICFCKPTLLLFFCRHVNDKCLSLVLLRQTRHDYTKGKAWKLGGRTTALVSFTASTSTWVMLTSP